MLRAAKLITAAGGAYVSTQAWKGDKKLAEVLGPCGKQIYWDPFEDVCQEGGEEKGGLAPATATTTAMKPKAIVVGAGVVGTSTAYALAARGYRVVVLESGRAEGEECSAVAAGGMQVSNPVVDPSAWRAVVSNMFTRPEDRFFHVAWGSLLLDMQFWRWMARFSFSSLLEPLIPSSQLKSRQEGMLSFTNWAIRETLDTMEAEGMDCGVSRRGALFVSRSEPPPPQPQAQGGEGRTELHTCLPVMKTTVQGGNKDRNSMEPEQVLSGEEVLAVEPSLRHNAHYAHDKPTWARFEPEAVAADSLKFTKQLGQRCRDKYDVSFRVRCSVRAIARGEQKTKKEEEEEGGGGEKENKAGRGKKRKARAGAQQRCAGLVTSKGFIVVGEDTQVVVAAGSWTPRLLWTAGLDAPVYPMKGYSIALDLEEEEEEEQEGEKKEKREGKKGKQGKWWDFFTGADNSAKATDGDGSPTKSGSPSPSLPSRIVSDSTFYTSRLGNRIRLTGMGEFSGYSTSPTPHVDALFRARALQEVPHLAEQIRQTPTRCGLRPFVSDGVTLLGQVPSLSNVFVNVGPGHNGWKICMGGANLLARNMAMHQQEQQQQQEADVVGQSYGAAAGKVGQQGVEEGEQERERELDAFARALSPEGRVRRAPLWARVSAAKWL